METKLDWRGNPITVGCTVVYPAQVRNRVWMNEAEVVEIEPRRLDVKVTRGRWDSDTGRLTRLTRVDRVTVVDSA